MRPGNPAFVKGNKLGRGRPKGSPNKDKRTVRDIIEGVLGKSIPERLLELAKMKPQQEQDILIALMPYTYPKLQSTEVKADETTHAIGEKVQALKNDILEIKGLISDEHRPSNEPPPSDRVSAV